MKYILDAAQMKEVDNYSISTVGIPSVVLMERAALSVTSYIAEEAHIPQIRWFYDYVEAETTGQMDLQWQDSYILRDIRWMFFYVRENILQKNTEYN